MNRAIVLIKKRQYEDAADLLEQIFANKDTSYDVRAGKLFLPAFVPITERCGISVVYTVPEKF